MATVRRNRWAKMADLDKRCRVGSKAWYRIHTAPQRRLSAWLYLHSLADHATIHKLCLKVYGYHRASDMTTHQMLSLSQRIGRKPR